MVSYDYFAICVVCIFLWLDVLFFLLICYDFLWCLFCIILVGYKWMFTVHPLNVEYDFFWLVTNECLRFTHWNFMIILASYDFFFLVKFCSWVTQSQVMVATKASANFWNLVNLVLLLKLLEHFGLLPLVSRTFA